MRCADRGQLERTIVRHLVRKRAGNLPPGLDTWDHGEAEVLCPA
ncbi:hypothetical protein PLANTIT3_80104 [Plantibacter sp. T3]|nr:hypothetical protein PLANTIT3_80104 [Plantibacter sp. T3]